jgi:HK97 family phage prohead protease
MPDRERKTFRVGETKVVDGEQGIVEHIVAVMGNVDEGLDVIHNGAFTKTITERLGEILVLDAHNTFSIMAALGKPIALKEISREELPTELLQKFPEATGALVATTQFLMNTPEGKGAFDRIASGAINQYSIGYETMDADFSDRTYRGEDVTVRNLRTIKLYEYSPVLWGMNEATQTLGSKDGEEKAGRVLSAVNASRILGAYQALEEALNSAGLLDAETSGEEEPVPETSEEELSPDDQADSESVAGSEPDKEEAQPPTNEALLGEIESNLLDLERIEVENASNHNSG